MDVLVLVFCMLMHLMVCVCACTRLAMCLYVFACLSHDVLWQSLTNRTGASGRWRGVGGVVERAIGGCRLKKRSYRAAEGGTRADCCHMMGI